MTFPDDAPITQALLELLAHERDTGQGKDEILTPLGPFATWEQVAEMASDELLLREDLDQRERLVRAFVRGAVVAAQAAEVARRRSDVFHPPID